MHAKFNKIHQEANADAIAKAQAFSNETQRRNEIRAKYGNGVKAKGMIDAGSEFKYKGNSSKYYAILSGDFTYTQKEIKEIQQANAEYGIATNHKKTTSNSQRVIAERNRNKVRGAVKRQSHNTDSLIGCTIDAFMQHLQTTAIQNGYTDFDINDYSGQDYHLDHIRPCRSFDLTDDEQLQACFNWSNYQILSASENMSKSDKWEGKSARSK